jgi:hypothetical protein
LPPVRSICSTAMGINTSLNETSCALRTGAEISMFQTVDPHRCHRCRIQPAVGLA